MSEDDLCGVEVAVLDMSHFYGDLWIVKDSDDEYFWALDSHYRRDWKPISKQLYEALLEHSRQLNKTPPKA